MPSKPGFLSALLCLVLCLPGLAVQAPAAQAASPRTVFIVHSYHPEYAWTQNVEKGIREALRDRDVVFEVFHMDAKRRSDSSWLRLAALQALEGIERAAPLVVITVDDAAQTYLAAPLLKGRASPQVVFCGVNAPLADYGFPASNVSGVCEKWHFREGFALLRKIVPGARSVAFLVDASDVGTSVAAELRAEARRNGPYALDVAGVETIRTFQEWQAKVLHYQPRVDALAMGVYNTLLDERTGRVVTPDAVMAWTNEVNRKPTLGFVDFAQDHGLLCGVLESGHEQGYLAGSMARTILDTGATAGSLPVRVNVRGAVLINMNTAERLGIRIPYEIIEAAGVLVR